jgi:hypothetical protein
MYSKVLTRPPCVSWISKCNESGRNRIIIVDGPRPILSDELCQEAEFRSEIVNRTAVIWLSVDRNQCKQTNTYGTVFPRKSFESEMRGW